MYMYIHVYMYTVTNVIDLHVDASIHYMYNVRTCMYIKSTIIQ